MITMRGNASALVPAVLSTRLLCVRLRPQAERATQSDPASTAPTHGTPGQAASRRATPGHATTVDLRENSDRRENSGKEVEPRGRRDAWWRRRRVLRAIAPLLCAIVIVWAIGVSPAAANGAIRGKVDLPAPARSDRRPAVAQIGGGHPPSHREDAADRRVSVVYLERAPRGAFGEPDERRVRMDQRNERFVPHVLAIPVGSTVDFPNNDATFHNVFSLSDTRTFDLGRYAAGNSKSVRFDRPGIVRVFCDIHSHMGAFILVFAHRYFAVTDADGRYHIDNVPPGTYTVSLWNESIAVESRQITVPDSGDVELDFAPARARASS